MDHENDMIPILLRAREGDSAAFADLCRIYAPLLESSVASFAGENHGFLNDEILQEARLALYRAMRSYRSEEAVSFGLYAKICIRNALISRFRREKQRTTGICSLESMRENGEIPAEESTDSDVSEALIGREEAETLYRKIRERLSDLEWRVFSCHTDGLSTREIATALGENPKSVENALQRALTKIRFLLR